MRLRVTKEHIAKGFRSSRTSCPIALAFKQAHPHLKLDAVVPWSIYVADPQRAFRRFDLPQAAQDFIRKFDQAGAKEVKPFEFELQEVVYDRRR